MISVFSNFIQWTICLIGLVFTSASVQAGSASFDEIFASFKTSGLLQIVSPMKFEDRKSLGSSAPLYLWPLFNLHLGSDVFMDEGLDHGKYFAKTQPQCRFLPSLWDESSGAAGNTENGVKDIEDSNRLTAFRLKTWITTCQRKIAYPPALRFIRASLILGLDYNFDEYRGYRAVELRFRDQSTLRGYLGIKGGAQRPLLIFRSGIFSNAGFQNAERFLFQQFFDASPFNILILPSTTGSDYAKDNPTGSVGAATEQSQLEEIFEWLHQPANPLMAITTDVHLMSVSLGSLGTIRWLANTKFTPKSFVSFCPVLDFKSTVATKLATQSSRYFLGLWANHRLQDFVKTRGLDENESAIVATFARFDKTPNFWEQNNAFADLFKLQTPTWIFTSENDPLVPFAENFGKVDPLNLPKPVNLFTVEEGGHCYFPAAYRRNDIQDAVSFFLRQQSGLSPKEVYQSPVGLSIDQIQVVESQENWHLQVTFTNGNVIPVSRVETAYREVVGPLTSFESSMIRRWAERNIYVRGNSLWVTAL